MSDSVGKQSIIIRVEGESNPANRTHEVRKGDERRTGEMVRGGVKRGRNEVEGCKKCSYVIARLLSEREERGRRGRERGQDERGRGNGEQGGILN
jgi:hypothetical protein